MLPFFHVQEHVEVLQCDLERCMATRPWQTAMRLKVRPKQGDLVSSPVAGSVDTITLVQAHWPSSKKKPLTWRHRKSGMAGVTGLAGIHGIVLGDLNIPRVAMRFRSLPRVAMRFRSLAMRFRSLPKCYNVVTAPASVLWHDFFEYTVTAFASV